MRGRYDLPPGPPRDFDDGQFDGDRPRSFGFQGAKGVPGAANSLGQQMPPWHTWGSTQLVRVTESQTFSQQLSRVSYGRPDTWHWWFGSKIVSGPAAVGPGTASLIVLWDISFGVGRGLYQAISFDEHDFNWLTAAPIGALMYSNTAQGPQRIGGTTTPNEISQIVAQDIQITARVQLTNAVPPGSTAQVELTSFLAPVNHIRPDWYRDAAANQKFLGGEVEGR